MKRFPQQFWWGAATSSYQVEGENNACDWWHWEKSIGKEQSGKACDHAKRYEGDFDLAKSLHHNAHRLSIEWSRVEPREGEFSTEAIRHYQAVIKALRVRHLEPMVTLHHFTTPLWLAKQGGWANKKSIGAFLRFCDVIVPALANDVQVWNTINEPTIYISHSFMWGLWPPQLKSNIKAFAVRRHMIKAHIQAYRRINEIYRQAKLNKPLISIAQHVSAMTPCQLTLRNRLAVRLRDLICNFDILDKMHQAGTLDFIGLNYYSRQLVDVSSWWIGNLLMETCTHGHHPVTKNALGWDIYPQGLYVVLKKLYQRYHLPIAITENGICTSDDTQRRDFIKAHLLSVHRAIEEGVDVKGYFYWSLLDNFEWAYGYGPRFGLINMDYQTQVRTVRESAKEYATICQQGAIT